MAISSVTTPVRLGFELDLAKVDSWFLDHVAGYSGPLALRQFSSGQSNPTYLVSTPERDYVLRRKPVGALLPSAHAVDREFRVMDALSGHTDVPVPRTIGLCTDDSFIGTWFYVMEYVDGRVFHDPSFPRISRAERPEYVFAMNHALASLHSVDYTTIGLHDYGRPDMYFERQIARWSKQYFQDRAAGRITSMDRLAEWLPRNIPENSDACLIHGDYRCDNLLFHPREPRVIAILDWELSTIGNPLADFGYHIAMYRLPSLAFPGLRDKNFSLLNLPEEKEYLERYCARTGRASISGIEFYVAFGLFRLAAIFHGIRGRLIRGTAASERAREYARQVEAVADIAWQQVEGQT